MLFPRAPLIPDEANRADRYGREDRDAADGAKDDVLMKPFRYGIDQPRRYKGDDEEAKHCVEDRHESVTDVDVPPYPAQTQSYATATAVMLDGPLGEGSAASRTA